jgi:hypothetical protein
LGAQAGREPGIPEKVLSSDFYEKLDEKMMKIFKKEKW